MKIFVAMMLDRTPYLNIMARDEYTGNDYADLFGALLITMTSCEMFSP